MKQENETDMELKGMNHPHCSISEHVEGYSVNECFSCSVPVNSSEPCLSLIENPQLFYKKLSEFNKLNGLSLISSAASSVLDLYLFYKEVIMRGGFAQVTKDGRWHEVSSTLNFSDRSPEPSFLLQNIYANLLYNFELIYGIRAQENLPAAQGTGDYWDQVGNKVPGVIEKEIECGYLISVTIGTEKLKGLLYHIKDPSVKQFALVRSLMDGVGLEDSAHQLVDWQDLVSSNKEEPPMGSSSKEETKIKPTVKSTAKKVRKDKEAPRATRNPYQFFLHHECDRLKKKHGKNPNINFRQMATDAWKCLPERDRQPYIEESRKDRERFKREMLAYHERKAMKNDEESRKERDRIKQEMFAYNERKAMKNDKAEFRIFDSEASMNEFHSNHHITIQTDESSKLFMQNGSMVGFATQLLENALEIDAAVKIELDDEFLSVP